MRYVSYRPAGSADGPWRAGVLRDTEIVDASEAVGPALGVTISSVRDLLGCGDRLAEVATAVAGAATTTPLAQATLGPPVPDPDKILCIGLNYVEHADEVQLDATATPTVFAKFRNSLIGPEMPITVPPAAAHEVDFEGELAIVIGRRCRRVAREQALEYVAGVMPFNDVSARDLQMRTSQWTTGKAVDTFGPCGPALVLLDEVPDLSRLRLTTRVNGNVVQDATTDLMIFDVPAIVAHLSSVMTLEVGDIIATGTPSGVGFTRQPPLFLTPGDRVEVEIEGIGLLRNDVEAES